MLNNISWFVRNSFVFGSRNYRIKIIMVFYDILLYNSNKDCFVFKSINLNK